MVATLGQVDGVNFQLAQKAVFVVLGVVLVYGIVGQCILQKSKNKIPQKVRKLEEAIELYKKGKR